LPIDQALKSVESFGDAIDHQDEGCGSDPDPNPDQSREGEETSGVAVCDEIDRGKLAPATNKGPHVGTLKTCQRSFDIGIW
jgi:hypothetical protein